MSAEEQKQKPGTGEEGSPSVGGSVSASRKADGDAAGDAARAKPKPRASAAIDDDALARALGGAPAAPAGGPLDYGLTEGDRLEVRWVVDDYKDDVHTESVVWWPCTLRTPAKKGGNGGGGDMKNDTDTDAGEEKDRVTAADDNAAPGAWEMHYDANDELGFEAEVRVVRMTGAGTLEDVTCSGEHDEEEDKADQDAGALLLRWRREGCGGGDESPDHSEGDEDEDDADPNTLAVVDVLSVPPDANGNISMQAFADAQRRADSHQISRGGEGLEEAGNRAFAALPMDRQQNIATVFHGFKEGLASALQELVRANGPDYVVTKDDIDQVMVGLRRGGGKH